MTALPGILAGLGAATAQSLFYLFSRLFLKRTGGGVLHLLASSHVLMGIASAVGLACLWPWARPHDAAFVLPLLGATGFYLLGQAGLSMALRRTESSRVAPMLGLKIVVLAAITAVFQAERLGAMRWAAVFMSTAAAFLINDAGGRIPRSAILAVMLAVLGYCLSDLSIVVLVRRLADVGVLAPALGVCLAYVLCGLIALPVVLLRPGFTPRVWRYAAPNAAAWLVAMLFLFVCFGLVGVVLGNIVQSVRGLMSVGMAPLISRAGMTEIEAHVPRHVFWKRLSGALLMTAAVALYVLER